MQKHIKTTGFRWNLCKNTTKLVVFVGTYAKTQQNYWFPVPPRRKHSKTYGFRCRRIENTAKLMVSDADDDDDDDGDDDDYDDDDDDMSKTRVRPPHQISTASHQEKPTQLHIK